MEYAHMRQRIANLKAERSAWITSTAVAGSRIVFSAQSGGARTRVLLRSNESAQTDFRPTGQQTHQARPEQPCPWRVALPSSSLPCRAVALRGESMGPKHDGTRGGKGPNILN